MENINFDIKLERIIQRDHRYPAEAYKFVNSAVMYTIKKLKSGVVSGGRHVNARELVSGLAEFSVEQFGPLAWEVLRNWNLTKPTDIGNAVFNLISEKLLSQSEDDSLEDFNIDFDISKAVSSNMNDKFQSDIKVPIIA